MVRLTGGILVVEFFFFGDLGASVVEGCHNRAACYDCHCILYLIRSAVEDVYQWSLGQVEGDGVVMVVKGDSELLGRAQKGLYRS